MYINEKLELNFDQNQVPEVNLLRRNIENN